uniref:Uncharacterized protein n=1 Tax=Trichogramma kaykai TaxID=54128 RepID=A0ABD2WNP6_9HYME
MNCRSKFSSDTGRIPYNSLIIIRFINTCARPCTYCHVGRQGPTSDAAHYNESHKHSSSAAAVSVHQATRRHLARTAPPL